MLCWPALAAAELDRDADPPIQVGMRMLLGSVDVGELRGTDLGMGLTAELPLERVHLAIELDSTFATPSNKDDTVREESRHQRARFLVRLPLLELQLKRYRGGLTASAGLGGEWVTFGRRSAVRRDFISWGLDSRNGFTTTSLGGSLVTIDYGFRFDLARAPEAEKRTRPPGCTGPCNTQTVIEPIDFTLTMGLAFSWGPLR